MKVNSPYYKDPGVVRCPIHGENITPQCPDCRVYKMKQDKPRETKKMKTLTEEEKEKISAMALQAIINSCKLSGIDFLAQPKDIQGAMINIYQEAVRNFQ